MRNRYGVKHAIRVAVWAAAGLGVTTACGQAKAQTSRNSGFALHDGDRVVFYGDSITEQKQYTTFAEEYILTRFPKMNITFTNSGWGGDRVTGGGGGPIDVRLQRDVLPFKPTVMTIMLGMNDGGYRALDQGLFDTYKKGYTHILDTVQPVLPGLRLTLIEPSPFDDYTRDPRFPGGYNAVLQQYAKWVQSKAQEIHATDADFNTPMVSMLQRAKAIDPTLAQKIIPDSVHPSASGHLVMAEALLKAWNAPSLVASVHVDASGAGKVVSAENARVSGLHTATGGALTWDETDNSLPMATDAESDLTDLVLRSSDFTDALNREPLQVDHLEATKRYLLKIDGKDIANFTGAQLAQGINLATLPTPMVDQSLHVLALTRQHVNQHSERWRTFQVPFENRSAAVKAALPPLLSALDADEAQTVRDQHAAAQPVAHHYEISIAPSNLNLAKFKRYTASDPNQYNWGIGGLTDGSWEATSQHCWASGDSGTFPKTATIDLATPSQISAVTLGVPEFGSTKTINVSVSADGTNFTQVGSYAFTLRTAARHTYTFPAVTARYVRLTYPDHYSEEVGYSANFVFTTEVEVTGPQ